MAVRWIPLLFVLLVTCSESPARAVVLNVYILTGQSNSLGTTAGEGSTPALYGPGADSADASTRFFWSNVDSNNTVYPPVLYGDSGHVITTLAIQQGDRGTNPAFWGPEFGFARTMAAVGKSNVMIIKAGRGGGGNTWWDKAAFDTNPNAGHMWGQLRDTVGAAITTARNAGYQVNVDGLLYLQGESNSATEASLADVRLSNLTANLRGYINANFGNAASHMQTVVGEISTSSSGVGITTTSLQRSLADSRPDMHFVQTHDQSLKSDGLHFGRDAKLEIGQRFADAFLDLQHRPASILARYAADLAAPTDVPHPSTEGWTETGAAASGPTPNVTLAGVTDGGTRGWRIQDDSSTNNPGYYQSLTAAKYESMFDMGWAFRAKVKVVAGEGLAFWSVSSANAPAGWHVAGGAGNMNGFQVDRVNGDQFQVKLLQNPATPIVNLGAGSANDFHNLELLGRAGSNVFDFLVDGQIRFSTTISDAAGMEGFENRAMFNSGDTAGTGRNVLWNEVSLIVAPEPNMLSLAGTGLLTLVVYAWRKRS